MPPPWFFAHTEGSTLFRAVNHVLDVGHTLILGPTGSGKSTLLGLMTAQWLTRYRGAQNVEGIGLFELAQFAEHRQERRGFAHGVQRQ